MALLPIVAGAPGAQFTSTTNREGHELGGVMAFADGRRFRWGRAAATEIATARLCQQTLNDANWDELVVPTARAIGDRRVTITNGTAAITVDLFAGGYLNVENDAGEGYDYTILSNSAAGNAGTLTVDLKEALQIAWTTSTTVNVFAHPYGRVIVNPASGATAMIVGVTPRIIPASAYGWWQTWGPASVLTDGGATPVINEQVIDSPNVAGAVIATASTAGGEEFYVGVTMEVSADGEHGLYNLRIG